MPLYDYRCTRVKEHPVVTEMRDSEARDRALPACPECGWPCRRAWTPPKVVIGWKRGR